MVPELQPWVPCLAIGDKKIAVVSDCSIPHGRLRLLCRSEIENVMCILTLLQLLHFKFQALQGLCRSHCEDSFQKFASGPPANPLLLTVHSWLSTSQARKIWWSAAGACRDCALVVVPCTCFGHGGHFSWQAQGKPRVVVFSRLYVIGAWDRAALLRCKFRGSTLDMVIIFDVI